MNSQRIFKYIEDDYEEIASLYEACYGEPLNTKEEILENLKNCTTIIDGEGFINFQEYQNHIVFNTVALKIEVRKTIYGAKLAWGLFEKMLKKAQGKHIFLPLLHLEGDILKMAIKNGFKYVSSDSRRIYLQKEMV